MSMVCHLQSEIWVQQVVVRNIMPQEFWVTNFDGGFDQCSNLLTRVFLFFLFFVVTTVDQLSIYINALHSIQIKNLMW